MSFNPNLSLFLNRVSGVSTNYFKLEPQNTTKATAGRVIKFSLPNNCILNLKSACFNFAASIDAANDEGRLPNRIDSLIDRVVLEAGGIQIAQGFNNYNVLRHIKDNLTCDKLDAVSGHPEVVRKTSYVDGAAMTSNKEAYSTAVFSVNHWEGFMGSASPSLLDTALLPELVLSIHLAQNNILIDAVGTDMSGGTSAITTKASAPAATYEIENFNMTVEALGMQDGMLDELIEQKIAQAGFIEIPFKQYFSFTDTVTGNNRWNVASQSISRIWAAYRDDTTSGYSVQGGAVPVEGYKVHSSTDAGGQCAYDEGGTLGYNKEKYISKFFKFEEREATAGTAPTYQVQINGSMIPQYQANASQMFQITKNSVPEGNMYNLENMSLDQYKKDFFAWCIRLNLPGSERTREISGLNSRGSNLVGQIVHTGVASSTNLMLFVECDSTLRVGAGKQLEVIV